MSTPLVSETDHLSSAVRRDLEADEPPDVDLDPGVQELYTSWALFILVALIIGALWTSYYLQLRKIRAVHETVVSIFAGMSCMVVGLIIRAAPGDIIQETVTFHYTYFFNLLLPPIILNSGYELHQANFFRSLPQILTFAFLGTFISAIVVGILVYLWTIIGLESLSITFVEALQVGATLSATDPVTVLAIFNTYKVDPKLYSIIFGESLLNDAVAIVMFETLQKFHGQTIYVSSVFQGFGLFLFTFIVSLIIGVLIGFSCALMLKHSQLRRFPQIESCLIALMAYGSYLFSNGCHMSGIVSLLFCGITLKHYAYYNMSRRTQLSTKYLFQVLAQLSENFIFIYLGLSLFTEVDLVYRPVFIVVTTLAICVARYCAVFPISSLLNLISRAKHRPVHPSDQPEQLTPAYQIMLFWAGLRGAVGVALAAGLEGEYAPVLKATILVTVVLTVIVFGGTTARMLEIMGIRTGVESDEPDSSDESEDEEMNAGWRPVRRGSPKYERKQKWRESENVEMETQRGPPPQRKGSPFTNGVKNGGASPSNPQVMSRQNSLLGQDLGAVLRDSDDESTASDLPPSAAPGHLGAHRSRSEPALQTYPSGEGGSSVEAVTASDPAAQGEGRLAQLLRMGGEEGTRWFLEFDDKVLKPVLLSKDP
ncbi:sodium/hydrogen exchanger [Saitoella complicata NRRL Y-17804]|uniref:sodium/hydrogen exchanger n=1 Tax=Saitoella complicata (strain BCRC 22490 / CBS 7301 / JCM 7358 / NBRC 10748 / NRRL Y-17804) TaxID=698492 RepID=UPI0008669E06|nr:sodium/hydrogen exchanger [Saitoella complicata NRRL Y-17804]ODQ54479.1 sodium/hydrogen exchanger [Saitoella complicata NRRL Y-17804]